MSAPPLAASLLVLEDDDEHDLRAGWGDDMSSEALAVRAECVWCRAGGCNCLWHPKKQ